MDKITIYDRYTGSTQYSSIPMEELSKVKPVKNYIEQLKEEKGSYDSICGTVKGMYMSVTAVFIVCGIIVYQQTESYQYLTITLLLFFLVRVLLNFAYQKAKILTLLVESDLKVKVKEIECIENKVHRKAMEDFMRLENFPLDIK